MSNPNQVPIEDLPYQFERTDQISLDPMRAIEAARGAAEVRRRQEALRDSAESFMGPIDDPDPEALESFRAYLEQRPAAPEEKPGRREKLPGVPHTSRVETLEESLTRGYGEHYRESHEENNKNMHRDKLIGRWAVADLLGDRTVSIDAQDELIDRVASMKHVSDAEKQRMLDAQERRMNELQDKYVRDLSGEELDSMPKSVRKRMFDRKEALQARDLMDRIQAVGIDGLSDEEFLSVVGRIPYYLLGPDDYEAYVRRRTNIGRGDSASAETGETADRPDDEEPAWLGHNPYDHNGDPRDGSSESGQENRRPYWWETSSESAGTGEGQAREGNADEGDQPVRSNPLVGPEAYGDAPPSSQNGERRRDPSDEGILPQPQIEPRGSFWQRMGQGIKRAGHTVNLWGRVLPREPNHPETKVSAIKGFARSPKRLVASVGGALRRAWESFRRPDEESDESEIPVEDFFNTERSPDHNRHPEV